MSTAAAAANVGQLVSQFLEAQDRCARIKADLDSAGEDCDAIERALSEAMIEQGLQSVKSDDGRTCYKARDVFVSVEAANRQAVVEACREIGLTDLIKTEVPTSQLKAHIREWLGDLGDHEQIPEQLRGLVKIFEKYSIRTRKS